MFGGLVELSGGHYIHWSAQLFLADLTESSCSTAELKRFSRINISDSERSALGNHLEVFSR